MRRLKKRKGSLGKESEAEGKGRKGKEGGGGNKDEEKGSRGCKGKPKMSSKEDRKTSRVQIQQRIKKRQQGM